eukprot:1155761-Pelagomonas_calceolata.AAC.1
MPPLKAHGSYPLDLTAGKTRAGQSVETCQTPWPRPAATSTLTCGAGAPLGVATHPHGRETQSSSLQATRWGLKGGICQQFACKTNSRCKQGGTYGQLSQIAAPLWFKWVLCFER